MISQNFHVFCDAKIELKFWKAKKQEKMEKSGKSEIIRNHQEKSGIIRKNQETSGKIGKLLHQEKSENASGSFIEGGFYANVIAEPL